MIPRISVIVPVFNPQPEHLRALYESLRHQSCADFEVLLVDDASTGVEFALITDPRFRVLPQPRNRGPAACRNVGATAAMAPHLFFTDDDCRLAAGTLETTIAALERDPIAVGNTVTDIKTWFGRAVALLGFPGGGCIGLHNVWRVSPGGYSTSFSSCNVAFRKETFELLGGFNASLPVPGGEDTILARKARDRGILMRYVPEQVVYHVERSSFRDFVRWQITRGRGNYYIRQHVPEVGGYLKLRLWTFRNSLRHAGIRYAPLVLFLIIVSVYYQLKGQRQEQRAIARSSESQG